MSTKLDQWIGIRHAKYDRNGDLTLDGIAETQKLALVISQTLGENPAAFDRLTLLTSTAKRAEQTASIIGKAFGVEPIACAVLGFDNQRMPYPLSKMNAELTTIFENEQPTTALLVTHGEHLAILQYLEPLGSVHSFAKPIIGIENSEAIAVNLKANTSRKLSPWKNNS